VLVTGPTGSGKTTTLYAALNSLNSRDRKILTVEDPVEYMIEGVNQVNVKPDIGYSFAAALRSFLRQDPDVMMVGEIRDLETSQVAAQAALTGHLVLSTLHTNDAASTVTRLLDMGVEDFLIASTLNGVVAQRLVRRLCPKCRRVRSAEEITSPTMQALVAQLPSVTFYAAVGCPSCDNTGYLGRTAIAEVLVVTDEIRRSFSKSHSAQAIMESARRDGMTTMFEEGVLVAASGDTTIEEVMRATMEV
jgi:general secretion pathway protein E